MAALDDQKLGESTIENRQSGALMAAVKASGYKNIRSMEKFPLNDTIGGGGTTGYHTTFDLWGRQAPGTDYPSAPIGSTYKELTVSGGAVTGCIMWLKISATVWKNMTTGVASV